MGIIHNLELGKSYILNGKASLFIQGWGYSRTGLRTTGLEQWFPTTFLEVTRHCKFCISPLFDTPTSSLGARVSNSVPGGPQPCNLGYVHTKPELSLSDLVSRNICVHTTMKPTQNHVVYMPDQYVVL